MKQDMIDKNDEMNDKIPGRNIFLSILPCCAGNEWLGDQHGEGVTNHRGARLVLTNKDYLNI